MHHASPEYGVMRGTTPREYRRRLARDRQTWETGGLVPSGVVPEAIIQGWEVMRRKDVSRSRSDPVFASRETLRLEDRQVKTVVEAAEKEFANLQGMIAIADSRPIVLKTWGDHEVLKHAQAAGLTGGVRWGNTDGGLNGIGWGAERRRSVVIFAEQHWREDQFNLVCTVCPIIHRNRLVAIINVTDFWHHVFPYTCLALRQFARNVERDLDVEGRQQMARICSVAGWPERISGPAALVDQNGSVILAHRVILEPGDQLTIRKDLIEPGPQWLPELGFCVLEPLCGTDGWLVRPAPENDRTEIQVVLDFTRPHHCVVRVQGPTVFWSVIITQPQHVAILQLLAYRSPDGLTATALAEELYGDRSRRRDVCVLISRLRKQVGGLLTADSRSFIDQPSNQLHNKSLYRFGEHVKVQVNPASGVLLASGPHARRRADDGHSA